ncbi:MAG TPA: hypothetical protein VGK49_01780, partial [Ilumatobacteraceae bacterium]
MLDTHTYANTGTGVTLDAGGNVLVTASDDTSIIVVGGALAGGFVGVGLSVGVTSGSKDTQAYLGTGNIVAARATKTTALTDAIRKAPTGNLTAAGFESTPDQRGLVVVASSTEDLFGLIIAGGGGFVGVGGAVNVTLLHVTTKAYIGGGAVVNGDDDGGSLQDVNVSALGSSKTLTIGGGFAGGLVGVGAGVDIGVVQTTTQAYIDTGATVHAKRDVDVYALNRKQVSTYAVAVGAGFVGAAGSISVWSVGSKPTTSYNSGGPDRGGWLAGTEYESGDTVTFNNQRYSSKKDDNIGHNPTDDTWWQADVDSLAREDGSSGSSAGDADGAASGGSGGYQSMLGPISGGGSRTNDRIKDEVGGDSNSGVQKDLKDAGNDQANITQNALDAGPIPDGTAASIRGTVEAGRNVEAIARQAINVDGLAGAAAGGVVAIGAGILIVNIGDHADAGISGSVSAGGHVKVIAALTEEFDGLAFVGGAGLAALGAQVVVLNDSTSQRAHLDNGSSIDGASSVEVTATANRDIDAFALGVSIGLVAAGAGVAYVDVSGATTAETGSTAIGQNEAVGSLLIQATPTGDVEARALGVTAGIIAGSGTIAIADYTPSASAKIGAGAQIDVTGTVTVTAAAVSTLTADTLGVNVGAFAVGISVSIATLEPSVTASVGANAVVEAGDAINISARSNHNGVDPIADKGAFAEADAPGGGLISAQGAVAHATIDPAVSSSVADGARLSSDAAVAVTAYGYAKARADASGTSLGGIAVGATFTKADSTGSVTATLDGDVKGASDGFGATTVKVLAISVDSAVARSIGTAGCV